MYQYKALVTDIIDGDTIKCAIDLGFNIVIQIKLRLAGIDTAELKDPKNASKALAAKQYLTEKALGKEFTLKSLKTEKYGRYLAFIYTAGSADSLNDIMVKEGYALPYNGKGRRPNHDNTMEKDQ